ncbi:NAD(P)-binding Rossmann-fold containing protein [Glarea lozoyensis ATCC 20868]|uniref:NAD(P)-binding Rossmann-fold containing protein n=1 Tax=Glarea lozoyensis (strain ATCC 20868 / MF5171) TaxID=1116229 RepID=S3DIT1_GLAL2|nr:NAD(P)-binding Rossmann-fold containing protein [Glarea lozoyensis ATCC 20868]EPE31941.1 NAD(P)-binding Rossmann-fold containing protein [Glarea lozoyensis ATCC 20868]
MPNVLIIGATRGLGASLANAYASQPNTTVYGTTRAATAPKGPDEKIAWVPNIDVSDSGVGKRLVNQLGSLGVAGGMVGGDSEVRGFDVVFITAGYFATEDFVEGPKWEEEVKMYTTSAISPPFIVHSLTRAKYLTKGSKVLLISSESGSITLRHEKEGGGNYGHHASKAALNMVGKLLSLDLKDEGVIISILHPGFMRTEMTAGVGFDKYWDDGGAVTPDEAAKTLIEWAEKLDMSKSGEYWAPRGPRDIGTAEVTIGKGLPTPLQLPW